MQVYSGTWVGVEEYGVLERTGYCTRESLEGIDCHYSRPRSLLRQAWERHDIFEVCSSQVHNTD